MFGICTQKLKLISKFQYCKCSTLKNGPFCTPHLRNLIICGASSKIGICPFRIKNIIYITPLTFDSRF